MSNFHPEGEEKHNNFKTTRSAIASIDHSDKERLSLSNEDFTFASEEKLSLGFLFMGPNDWRGTVGSFWSRPHFNHAQSQIQRCFLHQTKLKNHNYAS